MFVGVGKRSDLPEELPVSLRELSRSVQTDNVTVKFPNINYDACLAPNSRGISVLGLDLNLVTRLERREFSGSP